MSKLSSLPEGGACLRVKQKSTVVLFGEVLADIFPDRTVLGGAPFNVARHLKAFGQNPILITRLGNDLLSDNVLSVMSQNGMETLGIQCDNRHSTGQVQVHIEDGEHRFEILPLQAYDFIHLEMALSTMLSVRPALIYFGTLAQRCRISRRTLKTLLSISSAAKFLDINLRTPWYDEKTLCRSFQHADIVKLNVDELGVLEKIFELQGNEPHDQVLELMNRFDLEQALVTCGAQGAWQLDRGGKKVEVGVTNPVAKLVDTVGAGDAFAAVFILGALLQWPLTTTLERAHTFASAICEIRGAVPDHTDFYQPFTEIWTI